MDQAFRLRRLMTSQKMLDTIEPVDLKEMHEKRCRAQDAFKERAKEEKNEAFIEASEVYMQQLIIAVKNAINNLCKNGRTTTFVSTSACMRDYLIKKNSTEYQFQGNTLQYGYVVPTYGKSSYTNRDHSTWTRRGFMQPFKAVQQNLAEKGYYLYDVSDPSKSFKIHWILTIERKDPQQQPKLWHGLNQLP